MPEYKAGTITKIRTGEKVLSAAVHRIKWLFDTFPYVCLSFSGGKDSTVLFHLAADVARRKMRRFSVLFIDWEAQYQISGRGVQPFMDRELIQLMMVSDCECGKKIAGRSNGLCGTETGGCRALAQGIRSLAGCNGAQ